ncbi:MAG: TlpA family protein disulfide reductase [Actinobacteria bacterium]|nr:TlpA family protein disulfide reductase [Actinomycetota bacterium]
MANRQRAEARRKAAEKAARGEGGSSRTFLWVAVGLVVLLGVGGIIWATSGSDDTAASSDTTAAETPGSGLPTSQPVTVTGDPLPAFTSGGGSDTAIGMTAPKLEGLNFNDQPVVADAETNGAYMLVFLAHWCPHCNAEVPRLLAWKNSGAIPADLDVIGVATAVSENSPNFPPAEWFSNRGWAWPVMVDESTGDGTAGVAAQAYGASGWPYFVIVGADGKVKTRVSGEVEVAELESIVEAALAS